MPYWEITLETNGIILNQLISGRAPGAPGRRCMVLMNIPTVLQSWEPNCCASFLVAVIQTQAQRFSARGALLSIKPLPSLHLYICFVSLKENARLAIDDPHVKLSPLAFQMFRSALRAHPHAQFNSWPRARTVKKTDPSWTKPETPSVLSYIANEESNMKSAWWRFIRRGLIWTDD